MIVSLIPLPDIVEARRSDSTNQVPFCVHVESPAVSLNPIPINNVRLTKLVMSLI
jgi:hypothetical protein